jgi:hypothetical protein
MSVEFRFLELKHYNNAPHFQRFAKVAEARKRECTVILPAGAQPQALFDVFLNHVLHALDSRAYLPIVRFCDGEYSFYSRRETTTCWGERKSSIASDGVESRHINALRVISRHGLMCPNLNLMYIKAQSDFLEFLAQKGMPLQNYVPFYFVYALLVNPRFLESLRGRHVVLISNWKNKSAQNIARFFEPLAIGKLTFYDIPASGVAHGEFDLQIATRPDIVFVGAGIGAPLVLERLQSLSCVAIDTGFVLHMWDGTFDCIERLFLNYTDSA